MATSKGKKNTSSPNVTEENEAAENAFADTISEKSMEENEGVVKEMAEMGSAESDENTFEDDVDHQEDMRSDDDEKVAEHDDNEERVIDEDDFSDQEANEEDNEEDEVSEEEAVEEDDDEEENILKEREIPKEGETEANTKKDGTKAEENETTKLKMKKSTKIIKNDMDKKKKVQVDGSKKVNLVDKPKSPRERKTKKRVESMGMIFMCSSVTKKDCFQYRVFGLPENKKADVEKIYTGMRLFLFDVDKKLMYGIYKAAGPGRLNIEPKAFKSQFPCQVRYKVLENYSPLGEEKFKKIIKGNYYTKTKFDCKLNADQVKKLCRLFVASNKGGKFGKSLKVEKTTPVRRERTRKKRANVERHPPLGEVVQYHERPRKRPRKAITPPRRPPLLPSTLPSYAYERRDPYPESGDSYRGRRDRDPLPSCRPYEVRDPPVERDVRYRDLPVERVRYRDPPVERDVRYRDPPVERDVRYRDPPVERDVRYRDPPAERDVRYRDPPVERNVLYRDPPVERYLDSYVYRDAPEPYVKRASYLEVLPDRYKDRQVPVVERDSYLELRPYRDAARPELYSSYKRDSLIDGSDIYRGDRGVEYRSSYRREEPPETRARHEIASDGAYVLARERPSYGGPVYSAEYPSRTSLYRL